MNTKKIAERLVAMPTSLGFVERMVDSGVPLSEDELQGAWASALQKLGFRENMSWMDVGQFIQAYNRFGVKLEGAEKWLADVALDMAREAEAGGGQQMSSLGMSFVSKKTGCSACPKRRRLSRLHIRVSGFVVLKSRRDVRASAKKADKWKTMPEGWTKKSRREFWESLTGDAEHKVTECMEKMKGHIDDPGAFCASLKDRVSGTTMWRGEE